MPKNDHGLTEKQERFCREYLIDSNGKEAAIRAGFSEKTAVSKAHHLLRTPHIAAFLEKLKKERVKRLELDADQVLRELTYIAFSDLKNLFDDNGAVTSPRTWPKFLRRAVASIEVDELYDYVDGRRINVGQKKKVKFWPKVPALELLGKQLGMFKNDLNLGKETLEALVAGSRKDDAK